MMYPQQVLMLANRRFLSTTGYSLSKWHIDKSRVPVLKDAEIEEKVAKGWGPGGQAVNKANNAVFLKHIPTGIWVRCHDTRSLEQNRRIAKRRLVNKLDTFVNGNMSVENQQNNIDKEKHLLKKEKVRLKYEERRKQKLDQGGGEDVATTSEDTADEFNAKNTQTTNEDETKNKN